MQNVSAVEEQALTRLLSELNVADALQPVFQCHEPDFVEHIADEIGAYVDSTEVGHVHLS